MIREPAVAGRFYPGDPRELEAEIAQYLTPPDAAPDAKPAAKRKVIACMVPHAGYVYSGGVAGAVFGAIEIPRNVLILGPRHFPHGANLAINSEGEWRTPLGLAKIDSDLAKQITTAFPQLVEDSEAHLTEHSLEVELPFLQMLVSDLRFVPIAIGTVNFETLTALGRAIGSVISKATEPVLIVASSDMNHYEADGRTRVKDLEAIKQLHALDPRGLYDVVRNQRISMCGLGPAVTMLTAAKELGATRAELIRYATSGDAFDERDQVVGYAGMIFYKPE
jgi:MEMO1 family protein